MPLSQEDRDRIREEEWVRLQAREDFYKTNPNSAEGSFGALRWRGSRRPGLVFAFVAIGLTFVLLIDIAERINWNQLLR